MERFRYKGAAFPYNPRSLTVKRERKLARFSGPLSGSVIQDLGAAPAVVSGEGELFGESAKSQLAALAALFGQGGAGLLQLPGRAPMAAWFSAFQSEEAAGVPVVRYRFTFVEAGS